MCSTPPSCQVRPSRVVWLVPTVDGMEGLLRVESGRRYEPKGPIRRRREHFWELPERSIREVQLRKSGKYDVKV